MRLCYIGNYSIHTLRWVRYFAGQGHEVHLFTIRPARRPFPAGVTVHDLTAGVNLPRLRMPLWAWRVRRRVHALKPDLLHAHQVAGAGWLGAAAGFHPLIVTAWGSDLLVGARRSRIQRRLAGWTLRRADYVTCVSQGLAQAARELGADPARLEVAPWGVDTGVFYPAADRAELRAGLGLEPGPLVLVPRSLKALYNPLDVARAIPAVLAAAPRARFLVRTHICDAELLGRFQAIVREGKAENAVRYVGDLADEKAIADLYRAADVIVSVPSSDGTPSSVLEALACGAVPVLSDLPSLREWIEPGGEGLYVEVGNVAGIGEAVAGLLGDDELRAAMSERGVRLVRQRADFQSWMKRYEEIYRRLAR